MFHTCHTCHERVTIQKAALLNLTLCSGQTDSFCIVLKTEVTISLPNNQVTPSLPCIRCYKMLENLSQVKLQTILIGFNLEKKYIAPQEEIIFDFTMKSRLSYKDTVLALLKQ